ncbi:MAG: potassium transporter TrkG [Spirochaetales bacterium]|nr:potassium transporter TrkG [Spirochaetales bacterium]
MFFITLLKISSIILSIVGALFAIPLTVAFVYGESSVYYPFIIPMIVSFIFVLAVNIPTRKMKFNLKIRQTFLIVAVCWIIVSLMGTIPLYFSGCFNSFTDALFESVSGFSTTGSTVLVNIEACPRSINMFRCLTHWIGGMGIVTLTVALLPLLGVGGFQLIKAETTGPEKGKVTARITTTAKVLWGIYIGFTLAETLALKLAGMDFVDALSHSFSTLGTGGFSSKNSSIGTYNSVAIDVICMIFMFLSGINFSLFFYIIARKFKDISDNSELKAYIGILLVFIISITISLRPVYHNFGQQLRYGSFQVISMISTTGFGTADFMNWPSAAQFILFITYFIGGCSGSTGGGIKVIRWVILGKQVNNETNRMLHPHGVFSVRLNNRVGSKSVVFNVAAFMTVYMLLVGVTTFIGCLGNLDLWSSITGALSMVGNVGPGFNLLGPSENFAFLPNFVKWWYCFAMLAGRLELYTMIIFFMPNYWKR